MLAESKDQVLGGVARCLRASKEESQALVNDTDISSFKVIVTEKQCHEVTSLCQFWVLANLFAPLLDHCLDESS